MAPYRLSYSETLVETLVYRLNVFSQSASFDFFDVQTLKERIVLNSLVYWCVAFPIPVSFVYCGPPCMRIVSVSMYWIVKVYWFPYGPCFFFKDLNWWPFIHKWIVVDRCVARIIPSIVDVLWGSSMIDISCTKMGYYHKEICLC